MYKQLNVAITSLTACSQNKTATSMYRKEAHIETGELEVFLVEGRQGCRSIVPLTEALVVAHKPCIAGASVSHQPPKRQDSMTVSSPLPSRYHFQRRVAAQTTTCWRSCVICVSRSASCQGASWPRTSGASCDRSPGSIQLFNRVFKAEVTECVVLCLSRP